MALWTPANLEIKTGGTWLKASDPSTITIATGVSQWVDKFGNGNDVVQATATSQPAVISAGLNGLDVLRFDGSNDFLAKSGGVLGSTAFSVFSVSKINTFAASEGTICCEWYAGGSPGTNEWLLSHGANAAALPSIIIESSTTLKTAEASATRTTWMVSAGVHDLTNLNHYTDDVQDASVAAAAAKNQVSSRSFLLARLEISVGYYSAMDLAEIIILPYAVTVEERQRIAGYLHWEWGLEANLPADHPYKSAAPIIAGAVVLAKSLSQPYSLWPDPTQVASEQVYSIAEQLDEVALEQLWSMVLEVWLTQHYGDVPLIGTALAQPYGTAAVLTKALQQRWGHAPELAVALEQPWALPGLLQAVSEQRYGIAAEVLSVTCAQLYDIAANTTLLASLVQPYALAGEAARLYQFDTRLYIDGERVSFLALEWQQVDSECAWSCDFTTMDQAVALRCVEGAAITITSAGDTWQLKCYDGWFLDRRHGSELYRISAFSRTRDLDLALPLLGDLPGGLASALVADLAAPFGITVDWRMADEYLAAGTVSANDQTPGAVIRDIVHDARGIILATRDGNLLVVPGVEHAVPDWPTVSPAETIIARLERISTSEQKDEQRGYNRFEVSDQLASGGGFSWDEVKIDGSTKEVRLWVVPFDPARQFVLGHSGGTKVSIEPFGLRSLTIKDEQVEFVAGASKTTKPIHTVTSSAWQQANLGGVDASEDGTLTAAIPGYSLLRISYTTRFYRWIVRDPNIEDVQFIFHEVTS